MLLVLSEATPNGNQVAAAAVPKNAPRRPRKGITNIADKIGAFSSVFASLGIAAAPFRKTTALLDTLGRLFYILYQVGGLTIQERANLINVL